MKQRKILTLVLIVAGILVLVVGIIVRFRTNSATSLSAAALSLVGIAASMEYTGKKARVPLYILRALAVAIVIANPLCWLWPAAVTLPKAVQIAAMAVNIPLALIGFSRVKDKPQAKDDDAEDYDDQDMDE